MKENKIEKWISDSNQNNANPILILNVKEQDIENILKSIKKLNNIKRHFFVNKIDCMQQENKFSLINQILIIQKNHYILIKEIKEHIKRKCIYIEDDRSIKIFINALDINRIDSCNEIKYEVIERTDFLTILQDKTSLRKFLFDRVEILEKIGIHVLDKHIEFYMLVIDYYIKHNVIAANLIHKLYQIANLDFVSSSRAIGDKISIICGVKSKATHISNISINLRKYVINNNIKVYDLNFNQIEYDTKLDIATKLLRLDSKDLTVEKISTITKLPFYEIEKLYKQKYIR
ncbi:hypothetical protein [Aliarcobacter cryaerophilus]|uniref:Uncharacterized protein n=1 Tax=Aliarcobacter cryaerophilus TaxID=28198 RepID=A0A2S9TMK0_9BACT|nr:hypothetical protein [Aliarcobacter cryaerophilus]PRN00079.1 hypothetical protein CJ668_08695 [Arcobacter cryaerophilus gv. pseudocryaerophilus]